MGWAGGRGGGVGVGGWEVAVVVSFGAAEGGVGGCVGGVGG